MLQSEVQPLFPWIEANQGLLSILLAALALALTLLLASVEVWRGYRSDRRLVVAEARAAEHAIRELLRPIAFLEVRSDDEIQTAYAAIKDRGLQFTRAVSARSPLAWISTEMQRVESIMNLHGSVGIAVDPAPIMISRSALETVSKELGDTINRVRRAAKRKPIDWGQSK